jgi:Mg-chelatase subunit ChlD
LSEDIREKERVGKTSAVVLFVVDASGSMGAMQRMQSAKGAVLSMLMDSYQKRDKIGMVAFKGQDAELILSPCSKRGSGLEPTAGASHRRQDAAMCRPLSRTAALAGRAR